MRVPEAKESCLRHLMESSFMWTYLFFTSYAVGVSYCVLRSIRLAEVYRRALHDSCVARIVRLLRSINIFTQYAIPGTGVYVGIDVFLL